MTALSMLVKTCCFMWSRSTAVMTVRFGTETTKAVASTKTTDAARALAGGAVHAVVEAGDRGRAHVDAAALDALQRVRRELDRLRRVAPRTLANDGPAGAGVGAGAVRPAGARPGGSSAGLRSTTLIAPR